MFNVNFSTFNFTVPYLSWIAIVLLMLAAVVLYILPVRYLLMLWGTNKFFRRILRPHAVVNNELYDLLSRIPDDEMLVSSTGISSCFGPHVTNNGHLLVSPRYLC